jgi:hypothetical protein
LISLAIQAPACIGATTDIPVRVTTDDFELPWLDD